MSSLRNLFVCHTQAQLILATGLSLGRFKNDENHLILFRDFNLSEEFADKLNSIFNSTLFLIGKYPAENNTFTQRIRWQHKNNRILNKQINIPYDRVFAVCDWTPSVQYCLKRCYLLNTATEFMWLEDGIIAYFQNVETRSGSERFALTKFLRKVLFKYILGIGHIYDRDFNGMGGLKIFKQMYSLYPSAVREPYASTKKILQITNEEYLSGISNLYDVGNIEVPNNSIILIVDKLDTYVYPDIVRKEFAQIIQNALYKGQKVFCKFHPREEQNWSEFTECTVLDKNIAAESLYLSLSNKTDISIIGVKSTGLMSARKMGFSVYSFFNLTGEKNHELVNFFTRIGVNLIS